MNKKLVTLLATVGVFLQTNLSYGFYTEQLYDEYLEQEIIKLTMFNKLYELNDKHNLNINYLTPINFHVSFYSDLNCENGYENLTATGEVLSDGMVANNHFKFGTQLYIKGFGLKTVKDRGSKKYFSKKNNVDIFIPRNKGETDSEYYKRVNNMGRLDVPGYIIE